MTGKRGSLGVRLLLAGVVVLALAMAAVYAFRDSLGWFDPPVGPLPYELGEYEVEFDFGASRMLAPGSDNWQVTWADDGHQYAAWGDGGGFGGRDHIGRASLGIARIEGPSSRYTGHNVWGGKDAEHKATFGGKSYGLLSVKGVLYLWVSPGSEIVSFTEARLYTSSDHGATWKRVPWAFTLDERIVSPTFLQFGRDYAGARDEFVYVYAPRLIDGSVLKIQKPGQIDLMRVPRDRITDEAGYEFFVGLDDAGNPKWSRDRAARTPVFEDASGSGWSVSVSYNPGIKRYILATEHTKSMAGYIGIFDAPEPWGPWTTVIYTKKLRGMEETFFWNFSNKWLSKDGRKFVMIFTGINHNDAWGTVPGTFVPRTRPKSD